MGGRSYDFMNQIMSLGFDSYWRSLVVQKSEIQKGKSGLDICCGTGQITMALSRVAGRDGSVIGLDFSENMLAIAKLKARTQDFNSELEFIQGDATRLPFMSENFDCVTVGWGLRNVPQLETTVSEMFRVLKPGGKVVSIEMGKPKWPIFTQIYWKLFKYLVPLIGKAITGNWNAYQYLHDSSVEFIDQKRLAEIFKNHNLIDISVTNLFGGTVAIVEGRKSLD